VKEYLVSSRIFLGPSACPGIHEDCAHQFCARLSLIYLISVSESLPPTYMLFTFPFLEYAALFWSEHIHASRNEEQALPEQSLTSKLFDEMFGPSFVNWVKVYEIKARPCFTIFRMIEHEFRGSLRLYYSSLLGLPDVTNSLLQREIDVNAVMGYPTDGNLTFALHVAAENGHADVVRVLLNCEAQIDIRSGAEYFDEENFQENISLSVWKIYPGNEYEPKFYAERSGVTALYIASKYGHAAVVRILLESGAEVDCIGGFFGTALQVASYKGHDAIVQILLDYRAKINVCGGYFGNALQASSWGGHKSIVRLLLERGADTNAKGGIYGSALRAALRARNYDVAQILVSNGADDDNGEDEFVILTASDSVGLLEFSPVTIRYDYYYRY
jgi:ankyrin repeat protein